MSYLLAAGGFLLGYVFGSIPCGLWLVQAFHGIDIRKYGSGNIGTTNVFRTVGSKTALAVLVGDMLKGILSLYIISKFSADPVNVAVTALGALLGHNYSLFLGFKGGKGVATGLGLFLYMLPWGAAAGLGVWIIIVLINSFKTNDMINRGIFSLPAQDGFSAGENYKNALTFGNYPFLKSFGYSVLISSVSTALIIICCSMAAWYIARVNSKFCKIV